MLNIIYKDFMIQKKSIKSVFLYLIFIILLSVYVNTDIPVFLITTVTLVYFYFGGTLQEEAKFNYNKVLVSLPVKRHTIAITYYVEVLIFMTLSLLLCSSVLSLCSKIFQVNLIVLNFREISLVISATLLLSSLSIPLILGFGYNVSRFVIFILYFAFFFFSSNAYILEITLGFINNITIALFISIGIFLVSMLSSIFIMSNKEM